MNNLNFIYTSLAGRDAEYIYRQAVDQVEEYESSLRRSVEVKTVH